MDLLGTIGISSGMQGMGAPNSGSAANGLFGDADVSFGTILGQAANAASTAAADVTAGSENVQDAVLEEDVTSDRRGLTAFGQLTKEFAEKLAGADPNVVDAAMKLMLSVGTAAEKLFGTGSVAVYDEEAPKSAAEILAVLMNSIPETADPDTETLDEDTAAEEIAPAEETAADTDVEENEVKAPANEVLPDDPIFEESMKNAGIEVISEETVTAGDILRIFSDIIRAGIKEQKDADEIGAALKTALKQDSDKDKSSLADAVMTVLCAISGGSLQNTEPTGEKEYLSPEAARIISDIADVVSSDAPAARKADDIARIVSGAQEEKSYESDVKFSDYMENAQETAFVRNADIRAGYNSVRINNASVQAQEIKLRFDLNAGVPVQAPANEVLAFSDTDAAVYKELSEYVNVQLAERISEEIPAGNMNESVRELTVVLRPKDLGEVAVRITSDKDGAVSVMLSAANAEVGRAVSENAAALSESLTRNNIEVKDIFVVDPSEASSYMGLDFTEQGFGRSGYGDDDGAKENGSRRRGNIAAISSDISAADAARAAKLLKEAKLWATA